MHALNLALNLSLHECEGSFASSAPLAPEKGADAHPMACTVRIEAPGRNSEFYYTPRGGDGV